MGVERDEPTRSARRELALLLRSWWEAHPDKITQEALARRITERGVRISQEMLSRYLNRSRPTTARPDVIRTMHEVLRRAPEELDVALELHARATAPQTPPAEGAATSQPAGDAGTAAPKGVEPTSAAPLLTRTPHTPRPASRKKWPWIAVVAAAVVGASGLTAFMTLGDQRQNTPRGHGATPSASPTALVSPTAQGSPAGTHPPAECRDESCFGIDAKYAICQDDAATYYTGRAHGVLVELRFSPACQAAWAKMSGTSQGDVVRVTNNAGRSRHYTQQWGRDAHTTMVEAVSPDDAKACARTPRGEVCATKAVASAPRDAAPGERAAPGGR
uniref:DUF2690 domain-containing protein n=1 Tax=Actinoplanes tsinanensis TaxID=2039464 RepID=A0A290YXJ5_9ACTN|nr:hypothetical protein [Actinoplanes tsinanensis]